MIASSEIIEIRNNDQVKIGIGVSYKSILQQTTLRLLESNLCPDGPKYPLELTIADGLDGSGCHKIYNQFYGNPQFNTKNFILFAFKMLSIIDSDGNTFWSNQIPNSPFCVRPMALVAQKENKKNTKFLMDLMINPEVTNIEKDGLELPYGNVRVEILRTMFDGKMFGILSGAGGASCQLCTASFAELTDLELVRSGFPINRTITSAKEIFSIVDTKNYLLLPSKDRCGLTHEPISEIDIIPASPLHTYTCVFRWFMLLIYHIRSGTFKWWPTSRVIKESMKFTREFLCEKTGLRIDQPSSDGGTTSTGNMARQCFLNKNNLIYWVSTLISEDMREPINTLHSNLSVLLRIFNCDHAVDTDKLNSLCKDTYESILSNFPWANVTPSLHRLLAHSTELVRDCNGGFGLKNFSEEAVEACNKLIRRYREHLARKI
ncbi:hypothetical protein LOD99_13307 [Oopsacas minuta]|uniref:V(D)J recombination-activating protein 1 RNase H domain-containing protein n=1 Tax=Oopsacas minuta TaxID=111878 RepID=A0AAV7KKV4_9METZ|nr:hypothetical protein LOD99_13307 [Oopsacas minuta]